DEEKKRRFFQILDAAHATGGEMLEHRFDGIDQKYGTISSYLLVKTANLYPLTGDVMVIDIVGYERGTDFLEEERRNPIFYPYNYLNEETTTYRIPEGFRISHIPKNLNLDIGFFSVKREYEKRGKEITVTETIRNKRKELPKEDYTKVQAFYDQLPRETNQRIIFKRIKPWQEEVKDFFGRFRKSK
ncbi:MAG: hypothetical protein ABIG69_19160, partial [Bacteroidota bacterium]